MRRVERYQPKMRASRALGLLVLFVVAVGAAWWYIGHRPAPIGDTIAVYYTKTDGATLAPWRVSLGPARDRTSVAFYAATQCIAGPPPGTPAEFCISVPSLCHCINPKSISAPSGIGGLWPVLPLDIN